MSEQTQNQAKEVKKPKANQVDKKNTDLWKEKQAQKKKQKEEKDVGGNEEPKQEKKQKKEKKKDNKEKEKGGNKEEGKQEESKDKKAECNTGTGKKESNVEEPKAPAIKYKKLQTVESLIVSKHPELLENRNSQIALIEKEVLNLIRPNDTILYLGKLKLKGTGKLTPGSGKSSFKLIDVPGYAQHPDSQMVCRYEDLSYLISQQVDKIFIEASTIFQNGSALTPKGTQNLTLLASHYKKPIVLTSGSWNYTKISIHSLNDLEELYGEEITNKYDWIESQAIDCICLEFGAVLGSYVGFQVEMGYRGFGIDGINW